MTRQNIRNLLKENQLLEVSKSDWKKLNDNYQHLNLLYTKKELDKKVWWFEENLTRFLNKYTKIMQNTCYFKQQQNKKVIKARLAQAKKKKI